MNSPFRTLKLFESIIQILYSTMYSRYLVNTIMPTTFLTTSARNSFEAILFRIYEITAADWITTNENYD